ncbi:hypothetical protein Mcup_1081 [Metallosphaera cuprina Ar-4]|uniref:Uncharacterized protein n=1 Tax=Metallosphaera cuprina (strain Ar-4) TaxID=1006006 RepID=F4G2Y8_METCR|nr:hypothetical protein Mcup_1081 [Metallosphaera cuprina Ar-4]
MSGKLDTFSFNSMKDSTGTIIYDDDDETNNFQLHEGFYVGGEDVPQSMSDATFNSMKDSTRGERNREGRTC